MDRDDSFINSCEERSTAAFQRFEPDGTLERLEDWTPHPTNQDLVNIAEFLVPMKEACEYTQEKARAVGKNEIADLVRDTFLRHYPPVPPTMLLAILEELLMRRAAMQLSEEGKYDLPIL